MSVTPRRAFIVLLACFVALAVAYSVVAPLGEASDEVSHWSYIQYLVVHRDLPRPEGPVFGESHQPPLYYLVGALATFWIPSPEWQPIANPDFALDDPHSPPNVLVHTRREAFPYQGAALAWHLVRLLSAAMGAVTVWATWQIGRLFSRETIALGAAAFVAFLPEFLYISGVVNNDNLVIMLSSLAVLQLARMLSRQLTWRDSALLGLVLGLALLTKLSGLVLWLFAVSVFIVLAWKRHRYSETLRHCVLAFGIATLIVAPWAVYNLVRYGDPVGWSLLAAVTPNRVAPMTALDWQVFWSGLYTSFWGRFGGVVQIRMPAIVYVVFGLIALLGFLGWIGYWRDWRRGRSAPGIPALAVLFSLFWIILLTAHIRWTLAILGTDQARQLFPGLPLLALFWSAGIGRLFAAHSRTALAAWGAASALLAIAVLLFLRSIYAPPPQDAPALTALGGHAPADFGRLIRFEDYAVDRAEAYPGDTVTVSVNWQALQDIPENYWLLLQLTPASGALVAGQADADHDQDGANAINKDGAPSAGRLSTDWWRQGNTFTSRHTVKIPDDAPAGMYTLRLGLHPFGRWDWLPVRGRDMLDLENVVIEGRSP